MSSSEDQGVKKLQHLFFLYLSLLRCLQNFEWDFENETHELFSFCKIGVDCTSKRCTYNTVFHKIVGYHLLRCNDNWYNDNSHMDNSNNSTYRTQLAYIITAHKVYASRR